MHFKLPFEFEKPKAALKTSQTSVPRFVVPTPPVKPMFKCIPNRVMCQRIVNRYNLIVQKMRDPTTGVLIPFPRFNRADF